MGENGQMGERWREGGLIRRINHASTSHHHTIQGDDNEFKFKKVNYKLCTRVDKDNLSTGSFYINNG